MDALSGDMEEESGQRADVQDGHDGRPNTKEAPRKATAKIKGRECAVCKKKLASSWSKMLCQHCANKVVEEESPSLLQNIKEIVKSEVSDSIKMFKKCLPPSTAGKQGDSNIISDSESSEESEQGEILDSSSSSLDEVSSGRPLFPHEDTDSLLKAIRTTIKVDESKEQKSIQDIMFGDLGHKRSRAFPLNEHLKHLIQKEWKKMDKKFFIPRSVKRKYPFDEGESSCWDRPPKLDAPIAKISKKSALPFEDLGALKDPMDRRAVP
ncbi:uncharacterized protein LOC121008757 [Bufo bufo]|uniref:uncharacterized protein LOC121008757 n=1 Tax=Bufo bufo TaxID=8384 RepID=UPI001ABDB424|nr:uncharacterized protein LOC121008757 [Bufo bufo]